MKFYFSFILLFFLFTLISSDFPSNFKFQNGEQSLIINGSGNNNFTLKNSQSSPENYTLNLSIVIKETFSDELSFELLNENSKDVNMTFYLPNKNPPYVGNNKLEHLKLSNIIVGNYYIIISKFIKNDDKESDDKESDEMTDEETEEDSKKLLEMEQDKKEKELENKESYINKNLELTEDNQVSVVLKYEIKNYTNKIRLRDDNEITLEKNQLNLIYEYGLDTTKIVILTVLGYDIDTFEFSYSKNENNLALSKNFFNGFSLIIDSSIVDVNETIIFKYKIIKNRKIKVKTRTYKNVIELPLKNNSHYDIVLSNKIEKECFKLNENSKNIILNYISYTKNIKAIINNKDISINKETSYLELNNNKEFCFQKENKSNYASLSFDIIILNENKNFPVIRGLTTSYYLSAGQTVLYKPELYMNTSGKAVINFHKIKGNLNLSIYENAQSEIPLQNDINGYFTYKYELSQNKNIYAKVVCSKNCEFDIEMKEINEYGYIYQNFLFQTILKKNSKETILKKN